MKDETGEVLAEGFEGLRSGEGEAGDVFLVGYHCAREGEPALKVS